MRFPVTTLHQHQADIRLVDPIRSQARKPQVGANQNAGHREGERLESVPDQVLLAHLLGLIGGSTDPQNLADRLLGHFGTLANVIGAPTSRLDEAGLHDALGRRSLRVIREVAARLARSELVDQPIFLAHTALLTYCQIRLAREGVDQVRILFLDEQKRLIVDELHQSGTVGFVYIYHREVFRRALDLNASHLVVARGRPTGLPQLMDDDLDTAKRFEEAGDVLGIGLYDYLVIGPGGCGSYRFKAA
ncbi:MAG TPA: JAB domain-containing protein [Azospirillaceae bacterium]|nr:JAB domain-containing protein [Azospirillaceae bacterium]